MKITKLKTDTALKCRSGKSIGTQTDAGLLPVNKEFFRITR
jgi:hypothetical protein